jgi:hypothetical protein
MNKIMKCSLFFSTLSNILKWLYNSWFPALDVNVITYDFYDLSLPA